MNTRNVCINKSSKHKSSQ